VTLVVIHSLQTIDIDEGDHQILGRTTCTIYLPLQLLHPRAPPTDVGQLIGLRRLTVHRGLSTIARRQGAIARGRGTFLGRSDALIRRPGAIIRGTGTIILRPLTISRCPERLILARIGCLIARPRHLVTLIRRDLARGRGSQTSAGLPISEMRRMLTMHTAYVTNPLIGPHSGFLVTGGLILI
jgi:hypothetical protein